MKDFYAAAARTGVTYAPQREPTEAHGSYITARARVAVYDGPASAPHIEEIGPAPVREYIEALSARVYELARSRGGDIPYTVVRELAENYIHAGFAEPVISILDGGHSIRFSDQGPGIPDKDLAVRPGFTTATSPMKAVIRGVGSGLPIVSEFLSVTGGRLEIADNLTCGSVITIRSRGRAGAAGSNGTAPPFVMAEPLAARPLHADPTAPADTRSASVPPAAPEASVRLTTRQKQVLALVLESGSAGPSIVSRELHVGLSTAYRDLASLEEMGLIESSGGKRMLTPAGLAYLGGIASPEQ